MGKQSKDQTTADAFADSWNSLPAGSVYTKDQFTDWVSPLGVSDIEGAEVLELGCGNGSLMTHMLDWKPNHLHGVELGNAIQSAYRNLDLSPHQNWSLEQADLVSYEGCGYDIVYCIGVLHHLQNPSTGFSAVLANVKPKGQFHCWVYAQEGNGLVRAFVDPLRRVTSQFPWWLTKFVFAAPLSVLFFVYAKVVTGMRGHYLATRLPLFRYCRWIARRNLRFFWHVVFDQLVTPRTCYIERKVIERWLSYDRVDLDSTYIIMRNGNSWKFGGRIR